MTHVLFARRWWLMGFCRCCSFGCLVCARVYRLRHILFVFSSQSSYFVSSTHQNLPNRVTSHDRDSHLTTIQHTRQCRPLRRLNRQPPRVLDPNPHAGIRAVVAGQRRLPQVGGFIPLCLVDVVGYGDELRVCEVVCKTLAGGRGLYRWVSIAGGMRGRGGYPVVGTGLPGIGEWDDVVDVLW
jgi:hypothetical protein